MDHDATSAQTKYKKDKKTNWYSRKQDKGENKIDDANQTNLVEYDNTFAENIISHPQKNDDGKDRLACNPIRKSNTLRHEQGNDIGKPEQSV